MFYRLIMILLLSIFSINLIAIDKKNTKKVSSTGNKQEKPPFTKEMIEFTVESIKKAVLKEKNDDGKTQLKAMQLLGFSDSFAFYAKHEDIEKLTRVSRNWYKKSRNMLKAMYKPKAAMDTAILNRNKKAYNSAKKEYKILHKKFIKLIENPEKVKRKKKKRRKK